MMGRITTSDGIPRIVEFGRAFFRHRTVGMVSERCWLLGYLEQSRNSADR